MLKHILFSIIFLVSFNLSAQLISGSALESNRKLITPYTFKIKGKYNGVKYFELAVDREGNVTGIKEEIQKESLVSSPAKIIALEELDKLKFEGATYFPKFQHVLVKIEFVKE